MKTQTAINKLTKNGYSVSEDTSGEFTLIVATKDDHWIQFFSSMSDQVKSNGFTYNSKSSCAPTFGMNLKTAML